jgi:hypothetical protein
MVAHEVTARSEPANGTLNEDRQTASHGHLLRMSLASIGRVSTTGQAE